MDDIRIHQYTQSGMWIASYKNIDYASKLLKIKKEYIIKCIEGEYSNAGGYKWKLKKEK